MTGRSVGPIPFVPPLDDVEYGRVEQVSPLIRRVVAENPSKYTYRGTGTYIVGQGNVAVIDPGPLLESHQAALSAALAHETVVAILVTHCHSDHSPLAAWLRDTTEAPTYAFGPHGETEDPLDDAPDDPSPTAGAEGSASDEAQAARGGSAADDEPADKETIDTGFVPDIVAADGFVIGGPGWTFQAVHTPGHTSNHNCYALREERALFTGDHVMGWSTTIVSPPDGDMRAYCASMEKVIARKDRTLWPTHGNPVRDPQPFLQAYLAHRYEREAQVLSQVRAGVRTIPDIVEILYADVRKELHKAAGRSVLSHLRKLIADGEVAVVPTESGDARPTHKAQYAPA